MIQDSDYRKLLYKIAVYYYEDGLTQKQIGKRFGLSRIKISRLLRHARELKIVQIAIASQDKAHVDLERSIDSKYKIDEVIAVAPLDYSKTTVTRSLGQAAAESLIRSIRGKETITITWGSTLNAMVSCLPAADWHNLRVVQSLGGLSSPDSDINGVELVRRMAQVLGARPLILSSPGLVSNKAVRDALLQDMQISKVLSAAASADIALVGIGVFSSDSVVLQNNILTMEEVQRLKAKGAVGDIGLRFFNKFGEMVLDEIDERVVGLDISQYRKIKRVIGVAGGLEKLDVIRAAMRGKLIDVLITDDQTAVRLLQDGNGSELITGENNKN
jgi:DNA-binding transcriptional regulator LsrR (DeoR family)